MLKFCDVPLRFLPLLPAPAQPDRFRRARFHRTRAGRTPGPRYSPRPRLEPFARRLAERTGWSMLARRPAAHHPAAGAAAPLPGSHARASATSSASCCSADTLAHFRLANPPHPLHQFFETLFVLQQPSYSSIYPLGQGIALALGRMIFGHPWAGVVLSVAALLRPLLLDAARLDHARLGTGRRPAGGLRIRPAQPVDELLLGRRGVGDAPAAWSSERCPASSATLAHRDAILLGLGLGLQLLSRPVRISPARSVRGRSSWLCIDRMAPPGETDAAMAALASCPRSA